MTAQEIITSFVWIACVGFVAVVFYMRILAELELVRETKRDTMFTKALTLAKQNPIAVLIVAVGILVLVLALLGGEADLVRHPV